MLFCAAGVTLATVWYQGGFNICLFDTLKSIILSALMGICGVFEFRLYRRFGTVVDKALLTPIPWLYAVQLVLSAVMVLIHPIRLCVRTMGTVYGHGVMLDVVGTVVWAGSGALIYLERNYDLPAQPGRGHSIYLNVFWGSALAIDTLESVNARSEQWWFSAASNYDVGLLTLYIIQWVCELGLFILGIFAPGLVSNRQRYRFIYEPIDEDPKYGAFSPGEAENVMEITMGTGLQRSIDKMREGLKTGSLTEEFCNLQRQTDSTASVSIEVGKLLENAKKNRYCNVIPYDHNRVILGPKPGATSDYINASWISVKLPELGIENRYLASQGPVAETVGDFWQMVWEQKVAVILMLTELKEGSLRKCEKYWPEPGQSAQFSDTRLVVNALHTEKSKHWTTREFFLLNLETKEQLTTVQMQLKGWNDHKAPKDTRMFLDFWRQVRGRLPTRRPSVAFDSRPVPPLLVHCSAGVGRTGAYILLETLIGQAECEAAVRPTSVVRQLRDQRMAMVQTEEQFVYACRAALHHHDQAAKRRDLV